MAASERTTTRAMYFEGSFMRMQGGLLAGGFFKLFNPCLQLALQQSFIRQIEERTLEKLSTLWTLFEYTL